MVGPCQWGEVWEWGGREDGVGCLSRAQDGSVGGSDGDEELFGDGLPRLVSVYGRSTRKEAVCVATVKAEGDCERVMLVGLRETWGS